MFFVLSDKVLTHNSMNRENETSLREREHAKILTKCWQIVAPMIIVKLVNG